MRTPVAPIPTGGKADLRSVSEILGVSLSAEPAMSSRPLWTITGAETAGALRLPQAHPGHETATGRTAVD
jgi:hypothetical protein